MAPHSSTLAWRIPWREEPGGLQSTGSLGVRHDWATSLWLFIFMHWRRKWQPTPVFLPGESQGWGSPVGCCLWGHTESDTTEVTSQLSKYLLITGILYLLTVFIQSSHLHLLETFLVVTTVKGIIGIYWIEEILLTSLQWTGQLCFVTQVSFFFSGLLLRVFFPSTGSPVFLILKTSA